MCHTPGQKGIDNLYGSGDTYQLSEDLLWNTKAILEKVCGKTGSRVIKRGSDLRLDAFSQANLFATQNHLTDGQDATQDAQYRVAKKITR